MTYAVPGRDGKNMTDVNRVREIIPRIIDRIVKKYQPNKIILFGSYVYGEPTKDSDVDILIVTEGRLRHEETYKVRREFLRDFSIPIQPIFVSEEEFIETRMIIGGITYPASKYGETVYEKS